MATKAEEWKKAKGLDGYEVSDRGGLRCYWVREGAAFAYRPKGDPVAVHGSPEPGGMISASVRLAGGKRAKVVIARVMLETFDRKPKRNEVVVYADGDPANCTTTNCSWGSKSESMQALRAAGRAIGGNKDLGKREVIAIYKATVAAKLSMAKIGEKYGVSKSTVSKIALGKIHADVTGVPRPAAAA